MPDVRSFGRDTAGQLLNFRDLGGLPTRTGDITRTGLIFRSASLQCVADDEAAFLTRAIGIQCAIDLRATFELTEPPTWITDGGISYINLPFSDGFYTTRADEKPEDGAFKAVKDNPLDDIVRARYEEYLTYAAPNIIAALAHIADNVAAGRPTVFYCTYGKDRTGVLAALLLELLGVDREAIVEDYATSDAQMESLLDRMRDDPVHGFRIGTAPAVIYRAAPDTMRRFLGSLDDRGGAVRWATGHGLEASAVRQLRDHLVQQRADGEEGG